jgi:hypothetical protein
MPSRRNAHDHGCSEGDPPQRSIAATEDDAVDDHDQDHEQYTDAEPDMNEGAGRSIDWDTRPSVPVRDSTSRLFWTRSQRALSPA